MKKFTIITDSCSDLKSTDIISDKIEFVTVPLSYTISGKEYIDHEANDVADLTSLMKESKFAPKSSCPPVEAFAEVMRSAETNQIFVITISDKISGTFNSARLAAEIITAENSDKKIFVFDSLAASSGLARIVCKLVDLIKKDSHDFDALCAKLLEIRKHNRTRFLLNDLGNLVKSGRMSKVLGIITSVIPIKLICGDNGEGEIKKYKQVLGLKKGIEILAELPAENEPVAGPEDLIVISHCNNKEGAGILKTILESKFGFKNIKTLLMRGIATFFANEKGIAIAY